MEHCAGIWRIMVWHGMRREAVVLYVAGEGATWMAWQSSFGDLPSKEPHRSGCLSCQPSFGQTQLKTWWDVEQRGCGNDYVLGIGGWQILPESGLRRTMAAGDGETCRRMRGALYDGDLHSS